MARAQDRVGNHQEGGTVLRFNPLPTALLLRRRAEESRQAPVGFPGKGALAAG